MKKYLLMLVIALVTLCSTCFAEIPVDTNRWKWYNSTSTVTFYYDSQNITVQNGNEIVTNSLQMDRARNAAIIATETYVVKDNGYYICEYIHVYDINTGKLIHQGPSPKRVLIPIQYDSPVKNLYDILKYKI